MPSRIKSEAPTWLPEKERLFEKSCTPGSDEKGAVKQQMGKIKRVCPKLAASGVASGVASVSAAKSLQADLAYVELDR